MVKLVEEEVYAVEQSRPPRCWHHVWVGTTDGHHVYCDRCGLCVYPFTSER